MPTVVRLDPGDAQFVDVIHTDTKGFYKGGLGMQQPVGHIDFYPNGGEAQPGCSFLEFPYLPSISGDVEDITLPPADNVARNLFACGHNRVIDLYIDSIVNTDSCPMIGIQCESYEQFSTGACYTCKIDGESCSIMGYKATKHSSWRGQPMKMFLNTDSSSPYCTHNYLLELDLGSPAEAETWVQGYLSVTLIGSRDSLVEHQLSAEPKRISLEDVSSVLFSSVVDIGTVESLSILWKDSSTMYCFLFQCQQNLNISSVKLSHQLISSSGEKYV